MPKVYDSNYFEKWYRHPRHAVRVAVETDELDFAGEAGVFERLEHAFVVGFADGEDSIGIRAVLLQERFGSS